MVIAENIKKEHIASTKMFRSLNPSLKQMILKTHNVLQIKKEVKQASDIGLDAWENFTATSYANKVIVKEIIEEQNLFSSNQTLEY
ncbi:hypothetical protein [Autumnicola musiva]|uniref:Uncharacterized protein n=1 Tax=Autumnicola musiva TaxID=3075589 RepID=A0ABU3D2V8_9FLAO|nr:hypothetical protein [Zunongwangia sp. F117]MDT0675862.1 hypothetical protein [Zunongwangia sp. F117]